MSSKSLIKSGSSLLTRLLFQLKSPVPSQAHQIPIFPHLFPSVSRPQTSFHFPKTDTVFPQNDTSPIHTHDFFHPSGLPSLRFFLPDGDSSSEPMLCIKRPFQPSTLRRKRNHGFFARKATKGGRRVIARRIAKGRARITA